MWLSLMPQKHVTTSQAEEEEEEEEEEDDDDDDDGDGDGGAMSTIPRAARAAFRLAIQTRESSGRRGM